MGKRRNARELAMQALFFLDMSSGDMNANFKLFCRNFEIDEKDAGFFYILVKGVMNHQEEIDALITTYSEHWKMSRMSGVDRNAMRVAVYELLYCQDIPVKVSLNEAIDVGKRYGTRESGGFINGILDSIWLAKQETGTLNLNKEEGDK